MPETISQIGALLGGSWASGVDLYLTMAVLGIADRAGLLELPGTLDILSHPLVIVTALLIFLVEFFADKVPYVDNMWDSVHTFIRPAGGAVMAYMATSGTAPSVQVSAALVCGAVALDAHLTKATTRMAVNTSPEPFSNIAASVSEDSLVLVVLWLMWKHPVAAGLAVIAFLVFSVWFLSVMFRFLQKLFTRIIGRKEGGPPAGNLPRGY
jgi:hypothetical protein